MSQPDPVSNGGQPVWELVIEDMHRRDHVGRARYGTPLQAGNGRDALQDAYEEVLDLAVYLRQYMVEQAQNRTENATLRSKIKRLEQEVQALRSQIVCF